MFNRNGCVSGNDNKRGTKMKYTLIAAMFVASALTLTACGEKKQAETPAPAPMSEPMPAPEAAPAPEAPAPALEVAPAPEAAPESEEKK
jgi:hypothetical protein